MVGNDEEGAESHVVSEHLSESTRGKKDGDDGASSS